MYLIFVALFLELYRVELVDEASCEVGKSCLVVEDYPVVVGCFNGYWRFFGFLPRFLPRTGTSGKIDAKSASTTSIAFWLICWDVVALFCMAVDIASEPLDDANMSAVLYTYNVLRLQLSLVWWRIAISNFKDYKQLFFAVWTNQIKVGLNLVSWGRT